MFREGIGRVGEAVQGGHGGRKVGRWRVVAGIGFEDDSF
jgi:hypothetical protein